VQPAQVAALVMPLIEQAGATLIDELTVHPLGRDF
jgi:hypothetical protein